MRDEIQAFKRERILQEAVSLFYERGFTGTTLDDIAHQLGVTKPFIYTHFRSKTDLLAAICVPMIEKVVAIACKAAESSGSARKRLRALIVEFMSIVLERRANITIYFRDERSLPAEIRTEIDALRRKFDRCLARLLKDGIDSGEFAIADVNLTALAMGGMVSWAYIWHRPTGRLAVDELCNHMADLALQMAGVRVAQGSDLPEPQTGASA